MKKRKIVGILFAIGLLSLFHACTSDFELEPDQVQAFSINSTNTGTTYEIWVVLPSSYNTSLKYETVYVLDGNTSYLKTEKIAKIADELSANYNKQNVIVIGISSKNDRLRDFTSTKNRGNGEGGGATNYSKFIEFELIPKIQSDYAVDTTAKSRVLIGHSLGGLLTAYFFTNHPDVFSNYLSLSPSFWWDDFGFFKYEKELRSSNVSKSNLVFVGCGEMEENIVLGAKEFNYRLSTFYPNTKRQFQIVANLGHTPSSYKNAETGLDFYFKNK